MRSSSDYRSRGRRLTAKDLAERLVPDLHMNEFITWPPDLFALTSYIMSNTGAYQLVVSPPTKTTWEPTNKDIKEWLGIKIIQKEGEWIAVADESTEKMSDKVTRWLKSFLVVESPEKGKEWILDTANWNPSISRTEYFNSGWLKSLKSVVFDEKINTIAEHIETYAFESLSKPIKGADAETVLENYTNREISRIENIPNISEHESNQKKKEINEKESVSLADLLKDDDERDWIHLAQKLGDDWNEKLKVITDREFQMINHALSDEEGNVFTDVCIKGEEDFFDGTAILYEEYSDAYIGGKKEKEREKILLGVLLKNAPPLLLVCWGYFYNELDCDDFYGEKDRSLDVSDLLCNRDEIQMDPEHKDRLWRLAQSIFTLHAIADICCTGWGIHPVGDSRSERARWHAEKLLYGKGSLSTINPERGRVIPKRHNPGVGITLRSISSNLAFHQSSVDVVWRKTSNTPLEIKLRKMEEEEEDHTKTISILLFPFPLDVKAKHFKEEEKVEHIVNMHKDYGFFSYSPQQGMEPEQIDSENEKITERIFSLIEEAKQELDKDRFVDIVIFPESSLSKQQYETLQKKLEKEAQEYELLEAGEDLADKEVVALGEKARSGTGELDEIDANITPKLRTQEDLRERREKRIETPSILIAGVRESRQDILEDVKKKNAKEIEKKKYDDEKKGRLREYGERAAESDINFERNAVYCKYYSRDDKSYDGVPDRLSQKFKQYKHHRWHLDPSQIRSYGLSQILEPEKHKIWWEAMKVPRRRVSFLNVGKAMTISHLVCEDLARQDPIADLIRHVGPTLVVTLLMDGPQLKNRWSSRYASILSDDPGSSVITLTSFGMVKRYNSPYGLLSRVVALWSESGGRQVREIELANGAEAILLTLKFEPKQERTADGRTERVPTNALSLVDVIQIYPQ